jgi:hypothetical protein
MKNIETTVQKYAISVTCLACTIGAILFAVGALTVEGQSIEAIGHSPITETLPAGTAEAPTTSWDKPAFMGSPKNMGSPYGTVGQLDLSGS